MALVELNIYGDNDEIIKTFSTNRVRWGLIVKAVELEEKLEDEKTTFRDQVDMLNDFVMSVFPDMSQNDVLMADFNDIKNVFKMISNMAGNIDTKNA